MSAPRRKSTTSRAGRIGALTPVVPSVATATLVSVRVRTIVVVSARRGTRSGSLVRTILAAL